MSASHRAASAAAVAVPQLYLAGHNVRYGQAVQVELQSGPPIRFYDCLRRARSVVERFNRMALRRGPARTRPA